MGATEFDTRKGGTIDEGAKELEGWRMSYIKPIETNYAGYRFRSRLEARWAVFLDALGIAWEYEKEGFDLKEDGWYLPDFYLPDYDAWVEIKPSRPERGYLIKPTALSWNGGKSLLLVVGNPWPGEYVVEYFRPPAQVETCQSLALCSECYGLCVVGDSGRTFVGQHACDNSFRVVSLRHSEAFRAARSARFDLMLAHTRVAAVVTPPIEKAPKLVRSTPEDILERELIQVLIVQPKHIADAKEYMQPEMMTDATRRRILSELYKAGEASFASLCERVADDSRLVEIITRLHDKAVENGMDKETDWYPQDWYPQVKKAILRIRHEHEIDQIREQLRTWKGPGAPIDLLNKLYELEKARVQ
jgi:hypothetical protein